MERIISPEERIKRAEEIYYRRKLKSGNVRMPSSQVTQGREKRQFSLYKKLILQILICIVIYLIFSLVKEANYLFSEDVMNKTKEFLSKDINFAAISAQAEQFFKDNQDKFSFLTQGWNQEENNQINSENQEQLNQESKNQEKTNGENQEQANSENQEQKNNQSENKEENNQNKENSNQVSKNSNTTGIGGASNNETIEASAEGSSSKTQMEKDAEYIKKNFSMTIPAKGEITSHYGKREATKIISANHQGIDIGVVEGTKVVAAMEGKVSVVSKEGDYGTHVKIVNKDITTIYAHCKEILVKEGDTIKKGQNIALSGNTGNTTGPHLHFEIQRENRTIDPELILSWK